MICKDISFDRPEANLLYDEALFELAEQGRGGEVVRFWESQTPFIVLGRISKLTEDLSLEGVRRRRVRVFRRCSGGGTVVQGPGCLNFTLVISKTAHRELYDLRKSYRYILGKAAAAFRENGVPAVFRPISDLAVEEGERKFSGNAQRRGKTFILHHGTILYDFDLSLITELLTVPKDIPEYRRDRPHRTFVDNVPLPAERIKGILRKAFDALKEAPLSGEEKECLDDLLDRRKVEENVE